MVVILPVKEVKYVNNKMGVYCQVLHNTANFMHISFIMCMYFIIVICSSLSNPSNGIINCSLGDDRVPSYEDTCSFTCNTGYQLTGSDTRTCQSDGSWCGNETICNPDPRAYGGGVSGVSGNPL